MCVCNKIESCTDNWLFAEEASEPKHHQSRRHRRRRSRSAANFDSDNSKSSLVVLYCEERAKPNYSHNGVSWKYCHEQSNAARSSSDALCYATLRLRSRTDTKVQTTRCSRSSNSKADLSVDREHRTKPANVLRGEINNNDACRHHTTERFCQKSSLIANKLICRKTFDWSRVNFDQIGFDAHFFIRCTFSSQRRQLSHQQQRAENIGPQLGMLIHHLQQEKNFSTPDEANNASLNANNSQKAFQFQATSSDNLKVIPNQVIFESKKVNTLIAKPCNSKVAMKAENQHRSENGSLVMNVGELPQLLAVEVKNSTLERSQVQRRLPEQSEFRQPMMSTNKSLRPRTQPVNGTKVKQQHQQEQQQRQQQQKDVEKRLEGGSCSTYGQAYKPTALTNISLATLGFTYEQPIDWERIHLPDKTNLLHELLRRITTYKNADCIVRIGNDEFHCHLLVLQCYSAFFDSKNAKIVDLTESCVTSKGFSIIYDWMICPTNDSYHLLLRDNILEIFLAAQFLEIKELEEQCWAFIDNEELFSEDTAFLLYLEARKIGNTAIMELMIPRIMKFFLMLVSSSDFLELSVGELCLLLRSNYISVNSEMEVLMSAVRWLMHDWEGRKQHLLEVMKCIRFGLIAPWQLVDVKRNPENPEFMELMSYTEIQKMVDDGLAFVIIKYWYGNQTEDYYHWIDLLGLTEPTNRNWAGEDKNYVTYREFLLYLDEYQKTKISGIKNKKSHEKTSPGTSPVEESSPQSTLASKTRTSHFSHSSEIPYPVTNSKPSKNFTQSSNDNHHSSPHVIMLPPEMLNQYVNNANRSFAKLASKSTNVLSRSKN
ncbi:hypothetical protein TKK_0013247 [Trichogramma kaykai]|uniref:BACK domain-containing protein n=1 Tax=Trichogramma kaykai TaxID=54128 RepID=A0ABD2WIB1_9HYME